MNYSDLSKVVSGLAGLKDQKYPVRVSLAVSKAHKTLSDLLQPYIDEEAKLLREYASFDKDGNIDRSENGGIVLKKGSEAEFNSKYAELIGEDIELPDIASVDADELDKLDRFVAPAEIEALMVVLR